MKFAETITFKWLPFVVSFCFLNSELTTAQIPSLGRCPDLPVVPNFEPGRYLGRWFEIEKYFAIFELGGTCITATYTDLGNGTIGVFNSQIQGITRRRNTISGNARILNPAESAKLSVRFPSVPFAGDAPYWVLDTDYETYSIVWSCTNFGLINFQILWFLAREQFPSENTRRNVYDTVKQLGLRPSLFQKTEQNKCP